MKSFTVLLLLASLSCLQSCANPTAQQQTLINKAEAGGVAAATSLVGTYASGSKLNAQADAKAVVAGLQAAQTIK